MTDDQKLQILHTAAIMATSLTPEASTPHEAAYASPEGKLQYWVKTILKMRTDGTLWS